jgi:hypothetical protein
VGYGKNRIFEKNKTRRGENNPLSKFDTIFFKRAKIGTCRMNTTEKLFGIIGFMSQNNNCLKFRIFASKINKI